MGVVSTFAPLAHPGGYLVFSSPGIVLASPPAPALVAVVRSLVTAAWQTPAPSQVAPWELRGPLPYLGVLSDSVRGAFGGARGWLPGCL